MTETCTADSYNWFLNVTDGCWCEREKTDQDSKEYLTTYTMMLNSHEKREEFWFCPQEIKYQMNVQAK